jgi:hypothetical protein
LYQAMSHQPVRRFTLLSWISIYGRNCYMDFVKESDYASLEAENARLREERDQLRDRLDAALACEAE